MTDAFDYLQNIVESTSHRFDADVTTARIGKLRDILAHVEAQAAENERLRAALNTCAWALRQPLDEWKGVCERKALDEVRDALKERR